MTRRPCGHLWIAVSWAVALSGASTIVVAQAQSQPATPIEKAKKTLESPDNLADKQAVIENRVERFEDRVFQLSQALRKSEPDKAVRLEQSLSSSRSLMIRKKIAEVVQKLSEQQFADALDRQKVVSDDLQNLLKQLLEEPDESEQKREEMKQLDELRKELGQIIEKQKAHQQASAKAAGKQTDAQKEAAKQVKSLLDEQKSLTEQSKNSPEKAKELADKQGELRKGTEQLARQLGDKSAESKSAESLEKAAGEMKSAEKQLGEDKAAEAGASQKAAEKKLEDALKQLEQPRSDPAKKSDLEQQAKNQDKTTEETKKLLDDMKKKSGAQQQQSGKEGEQGEGKSDSGEAADNVEQAIPQQQGASKKLNEQQPGEASKKQQKALEKLQKAKEKIEESLQQLRREQQEEMLAALEARFRAMLARQVECTQSTSRLAGLDKAKWTRTDQLQAAEVSQRQRWVADEAQKAHYILTEEGTTVVFPQIVEQVRDDAREAADRLSGARADTATVSLQQSIEQTLRELIDAIAKKREENEKQNQMPTTPSDDDAPQPLLPGSAELKLLRACQERVNLATKQLHEDHFKPGAQAGDLAARIEKTAARQQVVSEMAKKMQESLTRPQ